MPTKCIKLEIKYNNSDNILDRGDYLDKMFEILQKTYKVCNHLMTEHHMREVQKEYLEGGWKEYDDKYHNGNFTTSMRNLVVRETGFSSNVIDEITRTVRLKYEADKKELFSGKKSLASFSKCPIFAREKSYQIIEHSNTLAMKLFIFSAQDKKDLGVKANYASVLQFVKPDASRLAILKRMMTGEYKQGNVKIQYNVKKGKWFASMSYTFDSCIPGSSDRINIMGVDLGITRIATMAVYNPIEKEHRFISYNHDVLNGEELIHFRQTVEARRRSLGRASKISNTVGHGYKRRMQKFLELGDKVARYRDTKNHSISRYIVNQAIKYNCAIIQFENLSGYTDAAKSSFLQSWSYFDLQSKVEYKAKEAGIEVVFIAPEYTSQRCNKCGCIDSANRDCKNAQEKFECVNCGHKDNADNNAAKNISLPDITELIKAYTDDKKKAEKKIKAKLAKLSKGIEIDTGDLAI